MKVCSLCSGSKGNSTFIEVNNKKFLFDSGKNLKYIKTKLEEIDIQLKDIDYIFITHTHSDHVSSLKNVLKSTNAYFVTTEKLFSNLSDINFYENLILVDKSFEIDGIKVTFINSSHDSEDSKNYIVEYSDKKVSLITDTGYIKQTNFKKFYNSNIFLMESNHDIELLNNSSKPLFLKNRILSDQGHLSNVQAGFYLSKLIGNNTKEVLLIHLSEENNTSINALDTVNKTLKEYEVDFICTKCAMQNEISEVFKID